MKVYFAGSIRGGRIDANLYERLIKYIQRTDIVLTEHVGNLNLSEERQTVTEIYNQDTNWLRESDVLIAECTCPSLGVGYELAYAERFQIPCHIFYNKNRTRLSAMLAGNAFYNIHPYKDEAEIYPIIDSILQKECDSLRR